MNGRFQILLRRRQTTYEGANVVVQCNPITGYAEYVPGVVDNVTPFAGIIPEGGWYDFSGMSKNSEEGVEAEDVNKLSLTWDKVNNGNSSNSTTNQDGSNYDKGISTNFIFFDSAFKFIYDWLLTTECQILNAVEVKIVDLIADGTYRIFEIKSDNLEYAPFDDPCRFNVKLREQDNVWHCIHKTFIWDNWQNWFKDDSTKTHPCFLTCIEPRPRLLNSVRMALMFFFYSNPSISLMTWITAGNIKDDTRRILNANRFVDAPLIRTYIENVAGKCGLTMDTIFDVGQDWENLCLFFPQAGYMHESDADAVTSPSLTYHFDNRWLITIAELFDKLKEVFCAEWYVTPNNKIVFKYTKDLVNLLPIYDFTLPGAEPFNDLVYTFNGEKKAAYGRYEYQDDGSDLASQEMSTLYNDIIDYDGPAMNPMLEGEKTKHFEFAPTGFIRDGRSKDYMRLLINDGETGAYILIGVLVVVIAALSAGVVTAAAGVALGIALAAWVILIAGKAENMREEFTEAPTYTGAVRLTAEQTLTPRLILWDGISEERAKVEATVSLPAPNTFYNPTSLAYDVKNSIAQDNPTNTVYNYPLYFDGDFQGNLFDRFHDIIDNPLKSKESHQEARFNVDLCEGMLHLFGVFENEYAQIGKIVKVEERDNYDVYVRIGNIHVDYDSNKINIKGNVIRRVNAPDVVHHCSTFQINSRCLIINGSYININ